MSTLAFLLDVDNTLLANDDVKKDFDEHLQVELGPTLTQRFWSIYERVRQEESVVDIPLSLKRLREQVPLSELDEQTYLHVHSIFDNYPFVNKLYPYVFETLAYLKTLGTTVVVSDGDLIFQAEKIVNSHLADAVGGRVLIYTHKQQKIDDIMKNYPADHYVMIDDKPQILVDSKRIMGDTLTVVFVQQGKYALEKFPDGFVPDITVAHIGDVRTISAEQFLAVKKSQ
jgi:FMN phosphatase YigB (HAD superfamily)